MAQSSNKTMRDHGGTIIGAFAYHIHFERDNISKVRRQFQAIDLLI
jgi:hypothetical protein